MTALALAGVHDQARAHRTLWHGVASVVGGVYLILGFAYLLGGITVEVSSRPYYLLLLAPGGMRTWGVLMLALGCAAAYGLLAPLYGRPVVRWWLRRVLLCSLGFSLFLACELISSGVLKGQWTVAGVVWWFACAVLSVLLVKLPPPNADGGR